MSLILDALRKSEAERRRGQAPSLYAEAPAPGTRLQPPWLPWLPVAGAVLLLVGAVVYYTRSGDEPVTKQELVEEGPPLVGSTPAAANAPTVVVVPAPPPPPPARARASPPAPTVDALVQTPANPTKAAADAATSHAPAAAVDAQPPPADASSAAAPPEEEVPPVAVLDPSTRGSLPPMKRSMHAYNADPARRFAIIDGQRVTEGTQLGNAIVLEIRRDGVLLDVGGRRVLLPRP